MLSVLHVLGSMLMMFSVTYVLPIATSLIYRDGQLLDFVVAAIVCVVTGGVVWLATRRHKRELRSRDGFLLVTFGWVLMSAIATVPLLIAIPGLSFTDAFFETMSGLSTTGATVLVGLEQLPPSINLWRAALHWYGGMGIIVLVVAILPLLGVGGMQLYKAETPGPVKNEKLTPRITETAKALWFIYLLITLACIGSLKLAGMDWFDAVFHGFSTLALGGFSSYDASIGHFDSLAIELVLIVFMLISAMNFSRHLIAWQQKSLKTYRTDNEAIAMLWLVGVSTLVVALFLWVDDVYPDFWLSLRHSAFNLVAVATTCGYMTQDFGAWPIFAPLVMLMLSCYACNTGSTGGGIKIIRAMILYKQVYRELLRAMHPSAIWPVRIRGAVIPQNVLTGVMAFGFVYTVSIVTLTLLMAASGLDIVTAFSAVVATLNNTGPGLNLVGPATTFAVLNDFQTWVCTFAMLLGRLEIFTLLVVLMPAFWRK